MDTQIITIPGRPANFWWLGPTTHLLAGLLPLTFAVVYGSYSPSIGAILLIMFLSLAPDLDSQQSIVGRWLPFISEPLERRYGHRTITHSLLAVGIIAFVSYVVFPASWALLTSAYASHLILDMVVGAEGIPLFWPNPNHFFLAEVEPGGAGEMIITMVLAVAIAVPLIWQPGIPYLQDTSFEDAMVQYQERDGFFRSYATVNGTITDAHIHVDGRFQVESLEGATFTMTCIQSSPCQYLPYRFTAGKTGKENLRVSHIVLIQGEAYTGATLTPTATLTSTATLTPTTTRTPTPVASENLDYSEEIALLRWERLRNTPGPDAALAYFEYCQAANITPCETPIPTITLTPTPYAGTPTPTPQKWLQRVQTKQAKITPPTSKP